MRDAVLHAAEAATVVIKAAAVADYRPDAARDREDRLEAGRAHAGPRPDRGHPPGARRPARATRFLVGFAAETQALRERARAKLVAKGVDLIVANDVSRTDIGFDVADNEVVLLDRWGGVVALPRRSKAEVADLILDRVQELRRAAREPQAT